MNFIHTPSSQYSHVRILAMLWNVCDPPLSTLNVFLQQECPNKVVRQHSDDGTTGLEFVLAVGSLVDLPLKKSQPREEV